jgi:hypothetical protein
MEEFIALNWPAVKQTGVSGSNTRGVPDTSEKFGTDNSGAGQANQPVVWETYRGKVETFPGIGDPPGYANGPTQDYGFDVGPQYVYGTRETTPSPPPPLPTPAKTTVQGFIARLPGMTGFTSRTSTRLLTNLFLRRIVELAWTSATSQSRFKSNR